MHLLRRIVMASLVAGLFFICQAAPGIDRIVRKTAHFYIAIDRKDSTDIDSLASLLEATWNRLADVTEHRPTRRIHIVFHDADDYSNGWAFAPNGWINIWRTPMVFDLRGGTEWDHNVLSHELAHVFTLQALGLDGSLLSTGLQIGKSSSKYDVSAATVWSPQNMESWLAEGLAQVGAELNAADRWDAQRDGLERIAHQSGKLLEDAQLRSFWGDGRQSEQIYNQGYSFIRFCLQNGRHPLPVLLRLGRKSNLRSAIESSFEKPFSEIFSLWKTELGKRHDTTQISNAGRVILPSHSNATWVVEPSVIRLPNGVSLTLSSRANDYGILRLVEHSPTNTRTLVTNTAGRLRLSPTKDRVLVLRKTVGLNRRTLNDIWILDPQSYRWHRITRDGRIQDADFLPNGFIAIQRNAGKNRIIFMDTFGRKIDSLPSPPHGDAVQVTTAQDGKLLWCTTMGVGGFRLWSQRKGESWNAVLNDTVERRDPHNQNDTLWTSRIESGRWVVSRIVGTEEVIAARSNGNLFAPVPVTRDSIFASSYEANGWIAKAIAIDSLSPVNHITKTFSTAVTETKIPERRIVPVMKANGLDIPEIIGYGITAGFRDLRDPDAALNPGTKWVVGGGILATNTTMETTLGLDVQMMRGGPGSRAGWDKGFLFSASTEAWLPILNTTAWYQQLTLESIHIKDGAISNDSIVHPIASNAGWSAQCAWILSSHVQFFQGWNHLQQGISFQELSRTASATLLDIKTGYIGLAYRNFEPGRHGSLSGLGASTIVLRQMPKTHWLEGVTASDSWILQGGLDLASHWNRAILFGWNASGSWQMPNRGVNQGRGDLMTTIGFPLGDRYFSLPITRHRRITWLDPLLEFRQSVSAEREKSVQIDQEMRSTNLSNVSSIHVPVYGSSPLAAIKWTPTVGTSISWKVLTVANQQGWWTLGVDLPVAHQPKLDDARWTASIQL